LSARVRQTPAENGVPVKSALIAAVVAAASGTAATILVTSKNIKNGTIQTADISAAAKRALRGQRGPIGLTGHLRRRVG
jgi:hypothetical protein